MDGSVEEGLPITGSRITAAIVSEMANGAEPLSRAVLVPSVFRVYLHPGDWERLSPILHELRADAEAELDGALAGLNKSLDSVLTRAGLRRPKPHRRVRDFWQVDFYPNHDDSCRAGEFLIVSDFPEQPKTKDLEGGETLRATMYRGGGSSAAPTAVPVEAPQRAETVYAQFRFADELGRRSYLMTRNEVHIGRGGAGRWVDLELRTEIPDISRDHAIVRRDAASGEFQIKDVSKFGTAVNGTAIPPSQADQEVWTPLPSPAHIVLAGKLELEFQAVPTPG